MKTPVEQLTEEHACSEAVNFVRDGKHETLQAAWDACQRGDWLLWWAGRKSGGRESEARKTLALASCECAREALPIFEKRFPDDKRVRECIETVEKWARGQAGVTIQDVIAKRDDAAVYGCSCDPSAIEGAYAYAATSSAAAADCLVANDAGYASNAASYSASYASDGVGVAGGGAARIKMQLRCAEFVRKHYPKVPH